MSNMDLRMNNKAMGIIDFVNLLRRNPNFYHKI